VNVGAIAVFVMGLRHGADPDHLAAIDNLTRNAGQRMPKSGPFIGSLFAIGHSGMVIAMALLAAALGMRLGHVAAGLTRAGELAGIAVLIAIGVANIIMLMRGKFKTVRSRLVPAVLTNATHPIAAIPTGALFGLGFETASQLAAYGLAFSSAQWISGLSIGLAFCAGMLCTDTIDSVVLARAFSARAARANRARRMWIAAVTVVAFGVAAQEVAALCGWSVPDETVMSALIVALLLLTALVLVAMHALQRRALP
jgi:high-affinity nickel-transport protein